MKKILIIMSLFCFSCSSSSSSSFVQTGRTYSPLSSNSKVNYYEHVNKAGDYEKIGVVECDGLIFPDFSDKNFFENAVKQAKEEARKRGGNCIIFLKSVNADEAGGIDLTYMIPSDKAAKYIEDNTDKEQQMYYFIIARK